MNDDLRTNLARLKALMIQANRLADEGAKTVREIETALGETPIAAEVFVDRHHTSPKASEETILAFKRIGGKFRIAIVKARRTEFTNSEGLVESATAIFGETPWLECSRDDKLATFPKLLELLIEIGKNAEKAIVAMQEAQPAVKAALESLR
jgi:hypothetical protein